MPHLRKSCRSSKGSTKSSGPNTALEATSHSVRFVAGVGLYYVARASAWALGAKGAGKGDDADVHQVQKMIRESDTMVQHQFNSILGVIHSYIIEFITIWVILCLLR
jgi:hypothetical protein